MTSRRMHHVAQHSFAIFALVVSLLTLPLITYLAQKEQIIRQEAQTPPVTFLLSTSSPSATVNQLFDVSVDVDTKEKPIQAVSFTLTYPVDKLTFVSIDTSGTAFEQEDEQLQGNGIVKIGRTSTIPVNGQEHVAKVSFMPKAPVNPDEFGLTNDATVKGIDNTTYIAKSLYVDPSEVHINENKPGIVDILLAKNTQFWEWFFTKVPILPKDG